ncbi:phage antirepressor KilAC domain-containing protein [Burkholderia multivorans]|uniref:Phage antirepressor KilAC domain-containing protein n=1 Tax=Burkholderia multivorans TaxID=87883 RepID=A0AAP2MPJ7_9BURK|nr:phage antirepressor KilAC domain-containing protein [Burkholderia multivorans]MBU9357497.1 phage antirepressor KilAC domain-containing protein [Burkholderia multivorans]MBU9365684.1 phage antirepressor KilAC domain-containing protein [Burkholderia multivorans]
MNNNGLMNFDPAQTVLTMNSLQIAELVESRHDSVKRAIERLVEKSVIAVPPMVDMQIDGGNNRTYTTRAYVFRGEQGKRDSIVVVAQLSPQFTARLVDRWQELEAQVIKPAFQIPQTLCEALRMAADLEEQRAALALENEEKARLLEEQKPHVEYAEALLASDETIDMAQMAQELTQAGFDIGRNNLFRLLRKEGILKSDNRPYREYADWFHVEARIFTGRSGQPHSTYTTLVTPRGEAALLRKYAPKRTAIVAKPQTKMRGLFKQRPASAKPDTLH